MNDLDSMPANGVIPKGANRLTLRTPNWSIDAEVTARHSVIVGGQGNTALHDGAILIGSGLTSDRPNQVKFGVGENSASLDLSAEDYAAFRAVIFSMVGSADLWRPE